MSMSVIKIPVQAWILDLYPASTPAKPDSPNNPKLKSIAGGLAIPSFWTNQQINSAFQGANKIWEQAKIEFSPVTIGEKEMLVPADDNGMWIEFTNNLSPAPGGKGVGVGFVYDLPGSEGGVGGGRAAVIALKKGNDAVASYFPSILAHELGHCLLGHEHREHEPKNLMFDVRHPKRHNPDKLDAEQITKAREHAATLL
ncbi:hypothetical protein ETAA8_55950 [Anatilimnocola aggregata]|uniref:Uncharacterized protein n=1 Tax=Anatilimnocola aggregata TaxID=2528021 RepID=A0A517YJQ6_9BACT|nr:hypothetical protein [Anatilimnocola aggregata]QDU30455.1 hypothetical protein ETAA8_55950 [Anatilimnocola aggregata]